MKRLAGRVEQRHAFFRQQKSHRPFHLVEAVRDPFAHRAVFVARRAHQRHLRIMHDKFAALELLRHGGARAEIDHVERADRTHIGQARADRRAEAVRIRRENAADAHVGDFRRRHVDHRGEQARVGKVFHRPPARAGGMEDETVIVAFKPPGQRLHAGRRHAKHGDADGGARGSRPLGAGLARRQLRDHAGQRMGAIAKHPLGDRIQPLHIGDRMQHHNVARAHVTPDIARSDGRNHDFRHAHRQLAHARRDQRRAARAASGNNAANVALALDPAGESLRHSADGCAAVAGEDRAAALRMGARHLRRRHVGGRGLAGSGDIDGAGRDAQRPQPVAQKIQLAALGVECADDERGAAEAFGERDGEHRLGRWRLCCLLFRHIRLQRGRAVDLPSFMRTHIMASVLAKLNHHKKRPQVRFRRRCPQHGCSVNTRGKRQCRHVFAILGPTPGQFIPCVFCRRRAKRATIFEMPQDQRFMAAVLQNQQHSILLCECEGLRVAVWLLSQLVTVKQHGLCPIRPALARSVAHLIKRALHNGQRVAAAGLQQNRIDMDAPVPQLHQVMQPNAITAFALALTAEKYAAALFDDRAGAAPHPMCGIAP